MQRPPLNSIADVLAHQAEKRPDHAAIEDEGRVVTYSRLRERVHATAANLTDRGIGRGDIVGVMLPDSADHITVLGALETIGAVSLSIDGNLPPNEKKILTGSFEVKALVTNEDSYKTSPVSEQRTLNVGAICDPSAAAPDTPVSPQPLDSSQPLIIAQSSGTTGTPKRLILTHRQFWSRLWARGHATHLTAGDRCLQVPGLAWITGYRRCLDVFLVGGTIVIDHALMIDDFLAQLERTNITYLNLSPGHIQRMLPLLEGEGPRFPNLKAVVSGAPMSPEQFALARERLTPNLFALFGTNEIGAVIVATPQDRERYPDSVGRPVEGIKVQVVDENQQPIPPMEIGQLGLTGADFPTQYLDNPEATAKNFRDGWFYPGDYAAINEEGYVFLMGRTDDAINSEGLMLYPAEIERVLASHPAVAEAAVFGCPHPIHGMVPVAAVVARKFVSRDVLDKICEEQLARVKRPRRIEFVPELPRNHAGKVLKSKLAASLCPN